MRLAILCAVLCGLAACGNLTSTTGSLCHATTDCAHGKECAGPDEGPVCGIAPREGCPDDTGCFNGQRCNALDDACSHDHVGSECGPACTGDMQCGAGFRCQGGACVALLCTEGFTCPDYQVCDPGRITATTPMYDRGHGCYDVACTSDAQCSGRFCVNSICQDMVGTCETPMVVARLEVVDGGE